MSQYSMMMRLLSLLEELKASIDQLRESVDKLSIGVTPVVVQFPVLNRVRKFTVDLTVPHTDEPLGIAREIGRPVLHAVVAKRDDVVYWKRNDPSMPAEELWVGYSVEDFELNELYITNPASSKLNAVLEVLVEWRE